MRRIMVVMLTMVTVYLFFTSLCFSETINISAEVPPAHSLNLTLFKLNSHGTSNPNDDTGWNSPIHFPSPEFAIDFGELKLDEDLGIFTTNTYYALDCGVNGGGPWAIEHTVSGDIADKGPNSLGDNIIVTFCKVTKTKGDEGDVDVCDCDALNKRMILADATDVKVTSTELAGGWLRIFYGIATGDPDAEEPVNAVPITATEKAGTQTGTIEITLSTP